MFREREEETKSLTKKHSLPCRVARLHEEMRGRFPIFLLYTTHPSDTMTEHLTIKTILYNSRQDAFGWKMNENDSPITSAEEGSKIPLKYRKSTFW